MLVTRQGDTTIMTPETVQAMIDQALQRNFTNTHDDESQNSSGGPGRPVQHARVCSYTDFMKCQPLNFKGTEGVVGLSRWLKIMHVTRQGDTTIMTPETVQAMIDQALQRNFTNTHDDESQNSSGGPGRPVQHARVCSIHRLHENAPTLEPSMGI
ncbi:hypothetical protein Tco_1509180 [Tanacetum coccineum]